MFNTPLDMPKADSDAGVLLNKYPFLLGNWDVIVDGIWRAEARVSLDACVFELGGIETPRIEFAFREDPEKVGVKHSLVCEYNDEDARLDSHTKNIVKWRLQDGRISLWRRILPGSPAKMQRLMVEAPPAADAASSSSSAPVVLDDDAAGEDSLEKIPVKLGLDVASVCNHLDSGSDVAWTCSLDELADRMAEKMLSPMAVWQRGQEIAKVRILIKRSLTATRELRDGLMRLPMHDRTKFVKERSLEERKRLCLYSTATPADWYYFAGGNVKRMAGFLGQLDGLVTSSPLPSASEDESQLLHRRRNGSPPASSYDALPASPDVITFDD